jgi:hypothetical protein
MRRGIAIVVAIALCLAGLSAQGFDWSIKGLALNSAIVSGLPLPTGADLQFGLPVARLGDHPLTAVLRLRGGYEDLRILRDPATGAPISEPSDFDKAYRFHAPNFQWALGATQGIVQEGDSNLVEAFAFYRGRFDIYDTSLAALAFSDMKGIFGTSFLVGAAYNSLSMDTRRVRSGLFAELSGEYGPAALNASSGTDFERLTFKVEGYLPLLSKGQASNEKLNGLSVYLAGFSSLDLAGGDSVPIWVMQSFGGRDLRNSLGDCVRGYPTASYDSSLKAVANGELRVLGPALFKQAWLVPMLYLFADVGYYSGFAGDSTATASASGNIMSAGAGLNFDIFDFAYVGAYCGFKFPSGSNLYSTYTTEGDFFWNIQFLLHF